MADLTVLLPPLDQVGGTSELTVPLRDWLLRGDHDADVDPGRESSLRTCFEFGSAALPSAALSRYLAGNDAAGSKWVFADPAYLAVDAVAVRMLACGELGLSDDERIELARALRPVFGDAGFLLETDASGWYLRCPHEARLPAFDEPDAVLGGDLMRHLPTGENQTQWRYLLNEAQVILHNHPVNARRAQRGQVPANSVWLWGAGTLPDWVRTRFNHVVSDDATVSALAKMAGIRAQPLSGLQIADMQASAVALIDLADRSLRDALPELLAQLHAALQRRAISRMHLCFASGQRVSIKPWHRWRFWRRIAR